MSATATSRGSAAAFPLVLLALLSFASMSNAQSTPTPGSPPSTEPGTTTPGTPSATPAGFAMPAYARSPWNFDRTLTIRVTPMTGYREPLSLSVAWSRHEVLDAEFGVYGDPFSKREVRGEDETREERAFGWGTYLRGGLSVLARDHRSNLSRPWTLEIPVHIGLRTLSQGSDFALFMDIHTGFEAVRWIAPQRGVTMGFTIGSPFFELTERAGVGLTPIFRAFVGLSL